MFRFKPLIITDDEHYNKLFSSLLDDLHKAKYTKSVKILNSNKYINLFSYAPSDSYGTIVPKHYLLQFFQKDVLRYILLSRKIARIESNLMHYVCSRLSITDDIIQFFSFYTSEEIDIMMSLDMHYFHIYFKWTDRHFKYSPLFFAIKLNNMNLYKYLMMLSYNKSVMIDHDNTTCYTFIQYYGIMSGTNIDHNIFIEHEEQVKFMQSLRYTWLSAIIDNIYAY